MIKQEDLFYAQERIKHLISYAKGASDTAKRHTDAKAWDSVSIELEEVLVALLLKPQHLKDELNQAICNETEPTELEKASEEYRLRRHFSEQDEVRNSKDFIAGAKWLARKFMDNSVFDQDSIENDRSYCNAILDLRRRMRDLTKVRE